jgi:tetratricopeptide (TPR) repeat protein
VRWVLNIELRAKLEGMAKRKRQTARKKDNPEELSDAGLPAGEPHEDLSKHKVLATDEDSHGQLREPTQVAATQQSAHQPAHRTSGSSLSPIRQARFSTVQKILVVGIGLLATMVLYGLLKSPSRPAAGLAKTLTDQAASAGARMPANQSATSVPQVPPRSAFSGSQQAPPKAKKPEAGSLPTEPLSLKVAQDFYLQRDFHKAYVAFDQIRQSLPADEESTADRLRDFLQLKMAFCMKQAADYDQADHLFRMVSRSHSPVVAALSNYQCSLLEIQKKQYLKARARAYQSIALINAISFDKDWALSLECDCHFLVAECLTRYVLSLCDTDKDIPEGLWSDPTTSAEPFGNLSEEQLRSLLDSGSEQMSKALLSPQIQRLDHQGKSAPPSRMADMADWSVTCYGAPIGELLARFAANTDLDVQWGLGKKCASQLVNDTSRQMPVSLYMPATTSQQFVTTAAGCVGMMAHLDDNPYKPTVNIFDPADYSSLSEHISLLTGQAISLWQRFLLTFHSDKRIANAHFALGLLHSQVNQVPESIAEYKLVANRFGRTSLAPFALLHSSKLKANLRDYIGARKDLEQLIEQYPDAEISNEASLHLADVTMKAQLYDEAARLYRNVYNLGFSLQSKAIAALGAAKCVYQKEDYENAAKWLIQYIQMAKDPTDSNLYLAYFLLGKTYLALGKNEQACNAFQHALTGQSSRAEYVETTMALAKAYVGQEHFVEALDMLENVSSLAMSQEQSVDILLLKSQILRAIGLVDKAIAALGDRAQYLPAGQLKAKLSFELAKCSIAKGDLELARKNLTEILVLAEPGPLAHEVNCELADVCLQLGHNSQTISICSQLLDSDPAAPIKQRALGLLATARIRQRDYDRAVLALLAQSNVSKNTNTQSDLTDPTVNNETPAKSITQ